jgi:hypothetical protein
VATIEFLFLANHAEVQNGLLYASGAGWSELYRGQPSPDGQLLLSHFAVATSILVPWDETNQPHHLTIQIQPEDDGEPLSRVEVDVEVGRPPGVSPETEQRALIALTANLAFPEAGNYRVAAQLDEEARSVGFRVHDEPKPPFLR